ncbi:MAG: stage 0 sporulation protein, partial [Firmicutes bacterium]|nr:stage 0 sporulation protein [Bacillota bacterium]
GGIGTCGKGLCCHTWLPDFDPVSIKMAKVQGLSLNPAKISGICGRLMCCLKYENEAYIDLKRGLPENGEKVKTPDGVGVVVDTNILREQVKVRLVVERDKNTPPGEDKLSSDITTYKKSEVKRLERHKRKRNDDDLNDIPDEIKQLLGD